MRHHFDATVLATVFCLQCVCALALSVDASSSYQELDYVLTETTSPGEKSSIKDSDVDFDVDFNSGSGDDENYMKEKMREKAMEKLSKLFGLPKPEKKSHPQETYRQQRPPQFMLSLYNAIAGDDGITRGRHPYNATSVRGFFENDTSQPNQFTFNISEMEPNEKVLEAELHLYRLPIPREKHHPSVLTSPHYMLYIYQIVKDQPLSIPDAHRLLSSQYVSAYSAGWMIVNVKSAVRDWLSGESSNLGFLVRASTLFDDDIELSFARRGEHHSSHQPILVLFNSDGTKITDQLEEHDDNPLAGYPRFKTRVESDGTIVNEIMSPEEKFPPKHVHGRHKHHNYHHDSQQRMRRNSQEISSNELTAENNSTGENTTECRRYSMIIDFESIGWKETVLTPPVFNAYHCKGACPFPLEAHLQPTNHAVVQSIFQSTNSQTDVESPCCVPSSLLSINVLLKRENSVHLKTYEDVGERFGCTPRSLLYSQKSGHVATRFTTIILQRPVT